MWQSHLEELQKTAHVPGSPHVIITESRMDASSQGRHPLKQPARIMALATGPCKLHHLHQFILAPVHRGEQEMADTTRGGPSMQNFSIQSHVLWPAEFGCAAVLPSGAAAVAPKGMGLGAAEAYTSTRLQQS
jgi:hypothetical protein